MTRFGLIVNFTLASGFVCAQVTEYDKPIEQRQMELRTCFAHTARVFDDESSDAATIARFAVSNCPEERLKFFEALQRKVLNSPYWSVYEYAEKIRILSLRKETDTDEAIGSVLAVRAQARKERRDALTQTK